MTQVFADTSFYVAVANRGDQAHPTATEWMRNFSGNILTSDFVIVELANYFCRVAQRSTFDAIYAYLASDIKVEVVPASRELLERGIDLYRDRQDKNWSLTDCISFVIMEERGVKNAATTDQHFAQAGFVPLLA